MHGFAAWREVEVDLITRDGVGHHTILGMLFSKGIELVRDVLIRRQLFLDPAFSAAGGSHMQEASLAAENCQLIPVAHLPGTVGDGCHAVAQKGLFSRDVHVRRSDDLVQAATSAQQDG